MPQEKSLFDLLTPRVSNLPPQLANSSSLSIVGDMTLTWPCRACGSDFTLDALDGKKCRLVFSEAVLKTPEAFIGQLITSECRVDRDGLGL